VAAAEELPLLWRLGVAGALLVVVTAIAFIEAIFSIPLLLVLLVLGRCGDPPCDDLVLVSMMPEDSLLSELGVVVAIVAVVGIVSIGAIAGLEGLSGSVVCLLLSGLPLVV
jgi:hypothetical protein